MSWTIYVQMWIKIKSEESTTNNCTFPKLTVIAYLANLIASSLKKNNTSGGISHCPLLNHIHSIHLHCTFVMCT